MSLIENEYTYLVKSVFRGLVGEATHENSAIRVPNDLGITEGVVCEREIFKKGVKLGIARNEGSEVTNMIKRKRKKKYTEASGGTEMSSINGVVVRKDIGAVYASGLNRMVRLGVEHRVYVASTHSLLFYPCNFWSKSKNRGTSFIHGSLLH